MSDLVRENLVPNELAAYQGFATEPLIGMNLPVELATSQYISVNKPFWNEIYQEAREAGLGVLHTDLKGGGVGPDGHQVGTVQGQGVFFTGPGAADFLTKFRQRADAFVATMKK